MGSSRPIRDYKDLDVWRKAFRLTVEVYRLTRKLPAEERYGLCSQMQRAAVSIPSNIAEGYSRGSRQDYIRFLRVARGSAAELETQLLLCIDLRYTTAQDVEPALLLLRDVFAMLAALLKALSTAGDPKPGS